MHATDSTAADARKGSDPKPVDECEDRRSKGGKDDCTPVDECEDQRSKGGEDDCTPVDECEDRRSKGGKDDCTPDDRCPRDESGASDLTSARGSSGGHGGHGGEPGGHDPEKCRGEVIVHKVVDGSPAGGWTFAAESDDVTPSTRTTGGGGATSPFTVDRIGDGGRQVEFSEEDRDGYTMTGVACRIGAHGPGVPVQLVGDLGWRVTALAEKTVHCTVVNEPDEPVEPVWEVTKSSDPASGSAVDPGDVIDYTLTVEHVSGPAATDLEVLDDISQLAPYVTFDGLVSPPAGVSAVWNGQPDRLVVSIDTLEPGQTLLITYRVTVDDDVLPGTVLRNLVLTNCPEPCGTEHPTPEFTAWKTSVPPSGTTVHPGDLVTYTLHAYNPSEATVVNAVVLDDLTGVLDDAVLQEPLPAGLTRSGSVLTWAIAQLDPGTQASVTFSVVVDADAQGASLDNVVTPTPPGRCPEAGGMLPPETPGEPECTTDHPVADPALAIEKLWSHEGGENPVDSGDAPPDVITYTVNVWNDRTDPVYGPIVTDVIPAGTTYVTGSAVAPAGWEVDESVEGEVSFSQTAPGPFGPIAYPGATFTFDVEVGDLAQPDPALPIPDLVNSVCVEAAPAPEGEAAPLVACDETTTPVKSVLLDGFAQCINDTPYFTYSITPENMDGLPVVALIWWTPAAYAAHDPSIPAGDEAAILADGASQVDYVTLPPGWTSGDPVSGSQLWPGAEVDAQNNPTDWPGWTLLPDGTWILDPAAPFYDLRDQAVVEIRVNPSTDVITAYPPPTPNCNAAPDQPSRPSGTPGTTPGAVGSGTNQIAGTGTDASGLVPWAAVLLLLGAALTRAVAGQRGRRDTVR
ncbi:DUF11 domain-containing protein [Agromyces sp. LHK192]|uniref:DUF7927 domain-containing protein n=1 Tax=Agromyces sp. LHK192 TaxID=2498704 RepID=UPI0013E34CD8|nr:DUF11 domain-containing protein [Agromyces sp. LHK192]